MTESSTARTIAAVQEMARVMGEAAEQMTIAFSTFAKQVNALANGSWSL